MPKIRVILETEDGQSTEQVFDLPGNLDTLDAIEEAVEQFKNTTLPGIEQGEAIAAIAEQSETTLPPPVFSAVSESGLYDGQVPEFVALADAICVASQKPTRQKAGQHERGGGA